MTTLLALATEIAEASVDDMDDRDDERDIELTDADVSCAVESLDSISSLAPIRSARSCKPIKPKCPLGANSVGLFGTMNPLPLSLTSMMISEISKLIFKSAWVALECLTTLLSASCAIR